MSHVYIVNQIIGGIPMILKVFPDFRSAEHYATAVSGYVHAYPVETV